MWDLTPGRWHFFFYSYNTKESHSWNSMSIFDREGWRERRREDGSVRKWAKNVTVLGQTSPMWSGNLQKTLQSINTHTLSLFHTLHTLNTAITGEKTNVYLGKGKRRKLGNFNSFQIFPSRPTTQNQKLSFIQNMWLELTTTVAARCNRWGVSPHWSERHKQHTSDEHAEPHCDSADTYKIVRSAASPTATAPL